MKALFLSLFLIVSSAILAFGFDMTNGVFYVDRPVECRLVSQNGNVKTNHLVAGETYTVGNTLLEMVTSNKMTFYFGGGPMIEAGTNSEFSVNLFDQEIKNLDATPRKAEFGTHNLSIQFRQGEFAVLYPNQDSNSTVMVSTPFTMYQLNGGKYYFRVSDKSSIAYVLEGDMKVHGDKNKVDTTDKGKLAVAVPFTDPASGVEDKIITSIKPLKPDEVARFSNPVLAAEKKQDDVQFFIVGNRVVGILMK